VVEKTQKLRSVISQELNANFEAQVTASGHILVKLNSDGTLHFKNPSTPASPLAESKKDASSPLDIANRVERAVEKANQKAQALGGVELFGKPFEEVAKVVGAKEIAPTIDERRLYVVPETPIVVIVSDAGWEEIKQIRKQEAYLAPEQQIRWIHSPHIIGPGIYYCQAVIDKERKNGYVIDGIVLYHEILESFFMEEEAFDEFANLPYAHANLRVVEETLRFAFRISQDTFNAHYKHAQDGMGRIIGYAKDLGYPAELIQRFQEQYIQILDRVRNESLDAKPSSVLVIGDAAPHLVESGKEGNLSVRQETVDRVAQEIMTLLANGDLALENAPTLLAEVIANALDMDEAERTLFGKLVEDTTAVGISQHIAEYLLRATTLRD